MESHHSFPAGLPGSSLTKSCPAVCPVAAMLAPSAATQPNPGESYQGPVCKCASMHLHLSVGDAILRQLAKCPRRFSLKGVTLHACNMFKTARTGFNTLCKLLEDLLRIFCDELNANAPSGTLCMLHACWQVQIAG